MATSDPLASDLSLCLMCLEAPGEHKIGACDHRFCKKCLTQLKENAAVTCPACRTVAPAIPDTTQNQLCQTQGDTPRTLRGAKKRKVEGKIKCKLCHFKGNSVNATNKCMVCRDLPLCLKCSKEHGGGSKTKGHVVVHLSPKEEFLCNAHKEPLELYCKSCFKVLCHLCVHLDHGDHEIESFNDVVFAEVNEARKALQSEKQWLTRMQADENMLEQSKMTAEQMQEAVIKAIEDHADQCVDAILKKKEELKENVRNDVQVIGVLTKRLEAMPELLKASEKIIAEATRLLDREAELHSSYVEKLVNTKQELAKLNEARPMYGVLKWTYQESFDALQKRNPTFHPRTPNSNIGNLEQPSYAGPRCDEGGRCVCETCQRCFRFADKSREEECRQSKTCVCGTCGSVFDRNQLARDGCCNGHTQGRSYNMCGHQIVTSPGYQFPL